MCTVCVFCGVDLQNRLRIRGVYKRHGDVRFCYSFIFILFPFSFLFLSWLIYFLSLFEFHRGERKTGMATNIAHTLRSLRPEASALLMDNLGLASVGGSSQVLRRQSQQKCDAGILGYNGKCVEEGTCMFVNSSPSSPPPPQCY